MPRVSHRLIAAAIAVTATAVIAAPPQAPESPARLAYSIGYDLGSQTVAQLEADGVPVDLGELLRGFADGATAADPAIPQMEMREIRTRLERTVATRLAKQRLAEDPVFRALAEYNLQRGLAYGEQVRQQPEFIELPGGAFQETLSEGDGPRPTANDVISISFLATLVDGTVVGNGTEIDVKMTEIIEGGRLALLRMPVGARWRLVLPPDLAYGIGGRAPDIGPNETVIIEVALEAIR